MRFLLSASLSENGLVEYSGQTAETKAICLPSRDQMPVPAPVLIVVSCFASPQTTGIIQSWFVLLRLDSKRMCLPSGLQRGWLSPFDAAVSCLGLLAPAASVETSQRFFAVRLASKSTTPCT